MYVEIYMANVHLQNLKFVTCNSCREVVYNFSTYSFGNYRSSRRKSRRTCHAVGIFQRNYYHLDMTFDRMVFFRPLPELANYTTPIENLFLTGAGTHPGGAISGMPGRNCDRVFLQKRHPLREKLADAGDTIKSTAKSVLNMS